jgi:hypothetical protein
MINILITWMNSSAYAPNARLASVTCEGAWCSAGSGWDCLALTPTQTKWSQLVSQGVPWIRGHRWSMELQENVRNIDRIATAHLPLRRLIHIRTVVLFAALRVLLHNMVSSQVKCRHDKTGDEPARFCTCQPSLDFERAASAARFYTGGGKVGHSISSVAYIWPFSQQNDALDRATYSLLQQSRKA